MLLVGSYTFLNSERSWYCKFAPLMMQLFIYYNNLSQQSSNWTAWLTAWWIVCSSVLDYLLDSLVIMLYCMLDCIPVMG